MLSSATVTPSSAESGAKDFTRLFFETAMGDGEGGGKGDGKGDMEENQEGDNQEFEGAEERDPITGQVIQR